MASALFVDPENSIRGIQDGEVRQLGISIEILRKVWHGVFMLSPREQGNKSPALGIIMNVEISREFQATLRLLSQSPDVLNELPYLFVRQSSEGHHTGSR